jgi:hypothetical protein
MASEPAAREDRPSIARRLIFSIAFSLVLLRHFGRLGHFRQPVYVELLVQVEAEKIGSTLEFDGRVEKVFQTPHSIADEDLGK